MTMICPTCHQPIPDGKYQPLLGCAPCAAANSYREVLNTQRHWIARMRSGEIPVRLTKEARAPEWHIALANCSLAWCGTKVSTGWPAKRRPPWPAIDPRVTPVCVECRRVFEELAEDEVTKEEEP